MRLRIIKTLLGTAIVAILLLTGCNNGDTTAGQTPADIVPDWLYQSLPAKFDNMEPAERSKLIKKEDIKFAQVNMKDSAKPQIAAYITISRAEGYFVLYEFSEAEEKYKEVYAQHQPVYGLQVYGAWSKQMVAFISGNGGTGYQENYFHLIGSTREGYKEIWTGLAGKDEFSQLPHYRTIGSLNIFTANEDKLLLYSQIKHRYDQLEEDIRKPDQVEKKVELYCYDPQAEKFSLI